MSANEDDIENDNEPKPSFDLPLSDDAVAYLIPRFRVIATKSTKCPASIDYIVQEAFVALLDGRRQWTNPLVVCSSVAKDWLSREVQSRGTKAVAADKWQMEIDPLQRSEYESFAGCRLDDEHRRAAIMYYVGGRSQIEIATDLGVSASTVSNWLKTVKEVVMEQWVDSVQTTGRTE